MSADLSSLDTTPAPEPGSAPGLRWGVLGPGKIARTFARALTRHTRSEIVAVGSRSAERSQAFAEEFGVARAHDSYAALVADDAVEAVYVASPHSEHREHALLAIAAGRHVLVEKSFTRNAAEAREVLAAAEAAGVFVMEAMWTRFLPHVQAIRSVLARGEIGEVVALAADHGALFPFDPDHRLYAPALAGGALLDLGVYPVSFAHQILGAPTSVTAVGALTETGVDGQLSAVLGYGDAPRPAQATVTTSLWARTATTASIAGTRGRIDVARRFYTPTSFTVTREDGAVWTYADTTVEGFQYQIAEAGRCVAEGRTQSPMQPWSSTLEVLDVMDAIRDQIGMVLPGE